MLRSGYWLAQYFSISTILREAPAQHRRSYLHAETDNNDSTYFVIRQLAVTEKAIASLSQFIAKTIAEGAEVDELLAHLSQLNRRSLRSSTLPTETPSGPSRSANTQAQERATFQTARIDLLGFESLGPLTKIRVGKTFEFRSSGDIPKVLRSAGFRSPSYA